MSATRPARPHKQERSGCALARALCLLFLVGACAGPDTSAATGRPTQPSSSASATCQPSYLVIDGEPRVSLYRVSDSGRALVGNVDLESGFTLTQALPVKDASVVVTLVRTRPVLSYRIAVINFASASVAILKDGAGVPPRLSLLTGNRLVVSTLGDTVLTPLDSWKPVTVGPPSSLAIDTRENTILYVVGSHPRYDSYRIEGEAGGNSAVTISGPDVAVSPDARLDTRQPAVFFMRPRSSDQTTLWRADSQGLGAVADLPGTHLGFGLTERYVAFVGRGGESVLVEIVGGSLVRRRLELARGSATEATVAFAGAPFAVTLRVGDKLNLYLVNAARDHVTAAGSGRAIGPAFACEDRAS